MKDNTVNYAGMQLQIPQINGRCHYIKAKVRVHEYTDGTLAIFHGPRKLAEYTQNGKLIENQDVKVTFSDSNQTMFIANQTQYGYDNNQVSSR